MARKKRRASTPAKQSANILEQGEHHWFSPHSEWVLGEEQTFAGEPITSNSYMTCMAAYACTKALSETIAGLPAYVYSVKDGVRTEEDDHPASLILSVSPNPEMDAFTFWELAITRLVNTGNFFAEIERDVDGKPKHLWPIHPSRVNPVREEDGTLVWEIARDFTGEARYEDPTWRSQNLYYLSNENMLNVVGFGSVNGIIAPGVLPAANELALDQAVRRYGGKFFAKGAMPTGIVEHPGFLDDPTKRANFRADLNQIHNNKSGYNIGVLWQGATYKSISVSPEQAQFLQTRKFTKAEICSFYGVPPSIIGDYSESKFATADAMIRAFVMVTLRNLAVRVEKAILRQLFSRYRDGKLVRAFSKPLIYQFMFDGLLRGDPKTQAETFKIMREGGAITADEWRAEVGYNPVGKERGGDILTVPGGYTRLENIDNQGSRQQSAPQQQPQQEDEEDSVRFDRQRLAAMIEESGLLPKKTQVAVDMTPMIRESVTDLAQNALERIHRITLTQVERWKTQDPNEVVTKVADFIDKQEARLAEALEPAEKLASKFGLSTTEVHCQYISLLRKHAGMDIFDFRPNLSDIVATGVCNAVSC